MNCSEVTDTKKLTLLFWLIVIGAIISLILVAADFPGGLRPAVLGWLQGAMGGTYTSLANFWTGIATSELYLKVHVFLWLFGGMFLALAIHQAHAANKLPFFKVKPTETQQLVMKEPQTIIIREQPQSTSNPTQQQSPKEEPKQEVKP